MRKLRFGHESGLEVAPWRQQGGEPGCEPGVSDFRAWWFFHYAVSGRESGYPDASVFATKRRRFPGPCGLPEKQRGGVLPESKLERKPSWHFIWIVSHMCRNWWKEMSFKGPSGSTVKWLWDSLETVAHAAEFKLGRKVAGYVRHKQSETGRSFCLFSHFKFSGFLFLSHSKVTLICVLSYVTTENWDWSKYVLWPLEIIPRTHFYCSRKTFLIYGEVNKGWYV